MQINQLPKSISNAVANGLKRLLVLRMEGAPSSDDMAAVLQVWLEALACGKRWEDGDDARVRAAFLKLCQTCTRWPQPAQLLNVLPPKDSPLALPEQPMSAAERAKQDAWLSEMVAMITGKMRINAPRDGDDSLPKGGAA